MSKPHWSNCSRDRNLNLKRQLFLEQQKNTSNSHHALPGMSTNQKSPSTTITKISTNSKTNFHHKFSRTAKLTRNSSRNTTSMKRAMESMTELSTLKKIQLHLFSLSNHGDNLPLMKYWRVLLTLSATF